MPRVSSKFITMCYDNYPDMKEFVFSCKGRPFAMLSSQQIPVPTLSLIDFYLVQDLGMKIKDIQCSKFTFAGSKLRILGKVSLTVQCVKDGKLQGNLHIKANVVEDLKKTFDTHSIAKQQTNFCFLHLKLKVPKTRNLPGLLTHHQHLLWQGAVTKAFEVHRSGAPLLLLMPHPRTGWPNPQRSLHLFQDVPLRQAFLLLLSTPDSSASPRLLSTNQWLWLWPMLMSSDQGVRPTSVSIASTLASEWRSMMLISSTTTTSHGTGVELPDCPPEMLPGGYYSWSFL